MWLMLLSIFILNIWHSMLSGGTFALLFYKCLQLCRCLHPGHKLNPVSGVINDERYSTPFQKQYSQFKWIFLPESICDKCCKHGKLCKQRRRRVCISKSTFVLQKSVSTVNLDLIQARKHHPQCGTPGGLSSMIFYWACAWRGQT